MSTSPLLVTDRLILRPMREDDVPALMAVLADPVQMAHYPAPFDRAGVERWVQRTHERYARDGFALWTVELKDGGAVVGDCGPTMQTLGGEPVIEIGWHIVPAHQRRGYATEAARACLDWVFEHTDAERVVSFMTATNLASRRVAEKVHARFLGPIEDRAGLPHVAFETRRVAGASGTIA